MLTVEKLKALPPRTIFAHGVVEDNEFGIVMNNTGQDLRWVACTGTVGDWTIYVGLPFQSYETIQLTGDKVCFPNHIKHLIECDEEAFGKYRL